MTRTFDPGPILRFIPSYWRDHYEDRDQLVRYWEALARLMDDEWAQIEQINDAANIDTVPTHFYHTYLFYMLRYWMSLGTIHQHFRKDFRSTAGQTVFYIGAWPDLLSLRIFISGAEVDSSSGAFTVTFDQDSTQPAVNPSGARLVFNMPRPLGESIIVFSDKELFHQEIEVSAGLSSIPFPTTVDALSTRIILKKWNITDRVTISGAGDEFEWLKLPTATTVVDNRVFRNGEIYEVVDGGVSQKISVIATDTEVTIPTPVNPLTAKVYRILDLDITKGKVALEDTILRMTDQHFPISIPVQASDFYQVKSVTPTRMMSAVDLEKTFEEPSFKVLLLGGDIYDGYFVDDSGVTFNRSFNNGVVLVVEAAYAHAHGHADNHQAVSVLTSTVDIPAERTFVLDPGLIESSKYPIQFFIDGVLQNPDTYQFNSTTQIQMISTMIPSGSMIDIYWADDEVVSHRHIYEKTTLTLAGKSVHISDPLSSDLPFRVSVSGVTVGSPSLVNLSENGEFMNFTNPIAGGSVVRIWGMVRAFFYSHEIDVEFVRAEFMQDGIDEKSEDMPGGREIQLLWGEDFTVENGVLSTSTMIEEAWFVNAYVNEDTGYHNFGKLIQFRRDNSDEYVRILRALFSGSYMGSQPLTIESLACIVLGSEYFIDPVTVDSISGTEVVAGDEEFSLDEEVPPRVSAGELYGKYHAISEFVELKDDWEPEDFVAIAAEQFSDDYRFARNLDAHVPTIFDGGNADYDTENFILEDQNYNFYDEEIWVGDLIRMVPTAGVPVYGRIRWVREHELGIVTDLSPALLGYGEDILGYGSWAYGGSSTIITIDSYRIWNRETDRLDEWKHLDKAETADIPILAERLTRLLRNFIFLVQVRWKGVRSEQALLDVGRVLDRTKPEDTGYILYTKAYEDDGIRDSLSGTVDDTAVRLTVVPDWAFVGMGVIGINGQTSPNAGSFLPGLSTVFPAGWGTSGWGVTWGA